MKSSRIIAALIFVLCGAAESSATNNSVQVSVLDVGAGQSVLISCGTTDVLVDFGDVPADEVAWIRKLEMRIPDAVLEFAINTHPHADHLRGLHAILGPHSRLEVKNFLDSGLDNKKSDDEEHFRRLFGKNYHNLEKKRHFRLDLCGSKSNQDSLEFLIPRGAMAKELNCPDNLNDCSIVTKLTSIGGSALIMGDATLAWEATALRTYGPKVEFFKTDVLVVGHHGHHSSSEQFLSRTGASLIAVSSAKPPNGVYPELLAVNRILAYLRGLPLDRQWMNVSDVSSSRVSKLREIQAYDSSQAEGRWEKTEIPANLVSTALDGDIDLDFSAKNITLNSSDGIRLLLKKKGTM